MYKFYSDSGHGWLAVPMAEINKLGIVNKISRYSYLNEGVAYLEEDCDFAIFYDAFSKVHKAPPQIEAFRSVNGNSHVRNYARFPGA